MLLWRNVFSNVFFAVAFCYISKLFYCRLGAIALLFLLCVFLHRNFVVFSDFFAVTSTLKGKECWPTCCFPTLKTNFCVLTLYSAMKDWCDVCALPKIVSSAQDHDYFCFRIVRKLLLPSVAWASFYVWCRLTARVKVVLAAMI